MNDKPLICNVANLQHRLFNAHIEWLRDEGDDPYILVDATWPGVDVPMHVVKDGKVTLNLSLQATGYVNVEKDAIFVGCRFGGRHYDVVIPNGAVRSIYGHHSKMGAHWAEPENRPAMPSMIRSAKKPASSEGATRKPSPFHVVK